MANRIRCIMFQGTDSGVGKSVLVADFCRVLWQKGLPDDLEMGKAQIYQAEACGLEAVRGGE